MKLLDTPTERYEVKGHTVYVKREDLCTSNHPYAPTFSKVRGLEKEIKRLASEGFKKIGYVETSVSMAGWGVAWMCQQYGLEPIIFDPQYTITEKRLEIEPHLKVLEFHRTMWEMFDATIVEMKPGRAKVNYYIARKYLGQKGFENMTFLPLGLPLKATGIETCKIARKVIQKHHYATVVVNIGSGTVCAGLLKGFSQWPLKVIGVMGRKGNVKKKKQAIINAANIFMCFPDFEVIQAKYEYTQASKVDCPFPTHPYYDLKAWEWVVDNIEKLESPILFWNIGSLPKEV